MNRELVNAKLVESYSLARTKLTPKERIWFDKLIKLSEDLSEDDSKASHKLMALDCMLVGALSAAAMSSRELAFMMQEITQLMLKIAILVKLRGA